MSQLAHNTTPIRRASTAQNPQQSSSVASLFYCLVGIAACYPVAFQLLEISGKPVDLVASDFLIMFLFLGFAGRRYFCTYPNERAMCIRFSQISMLAIAFCIYAMTLALVSYGYSMELTRVLSASKLVKPVCFLILGQWIARSLSPNKLLTFTAAAFVLIALANFFTTITDPGFPGTAWGKYMFLDWELYGYPNSPMSFFAFLTPLAFASADATKNPLWKWTARAAGCAAILTVVGSLSRSSMSVLAVGLLIYIILTGRRYILMAGVYVGSFLVIACVGMYSIGESSNETVSILQRRLQSRVERTQEEDPLSGRLDIWYQASGLVIESPLIGYAFEPFSNYVAGYDTPHQQYLEITFKTGLIGGGLYLTLLCTILLTLKKQCYFCSPKSSEYYLYRAFLAGFAGILIGNLSQPNLTFSLTGNIVFLLSGMSLSRNAFHEIMQTHQKNQPSQATEELVKQNLLPQERRQRTAA